MHRMAPLFSHLCRTPPLLSALKSHHAFLIKTSNLTEFHSRNLLPMKIAARLCTASALLRDSSSSSLSSRKATKKARRDAPESVLRHKLNSCSENVNLIEALRLYDEARADKVPLNVHHYNILLYLCTAGLSNSNEGDGSSGKLGLERGFEIYKQMGLDNVAPNEATFTNAARLAATKEDPEMAFDLVKQMQKNGIVPKLRSYEPALLGFCRNLMAEKAYKVDAHMIQTGVLALLKLSYEVKRPEKVYEILHRMRKTVRQVSEETARVVEDWFKSKSAEEVGKENWDVEKVKQGILKADMQRFGKSTISAVENNLKQRRWSPLPLPCRSIPDPVGQDLDFVNVAHSHLLHSDWSMLEKLASKLTPFRIKHILLKTQQDYAVSLQFFKWVEQKDPSLITLDVHSMILHILTKNSKFKSAESMLTKMIEKHLGLCNFAEKLFEALLYSYQTCGSSSRVFDALFKTYAHLKKFRSATDVFCWMREYGFLATVESCNAYLSSLLSLNRTDIFLSFYKEMQRSRISPNVYTLNMLIASFCKSGKIEKAVDVYKDMEKMNICPTIASYNTLIAGYCNQGILSTALNLKKMMERKGLCGNEITYNTLINGFCKEGKLNEANKLFREMKSVDLAPNVVTYNTLINGFCKAKNNEMGCRLFDEMSINGIKADILTYNALILGLCSEGKTKKAAYLVKELDKRNLVPNSSTFSALIRGQCVRKNFERAFQLYNSMVSSGFHPNEEILTTLLSTFTENNEYNGAILILKEMLKRSMSPDLKIVSDLWNGVRQYGNEEMIKSLCKEIESKHLILEGFG